MAIHRKAKNFWWPKKFIKVSNSTLQRLLRTLESAPWLKRFSNLCGENLGVRPRCKNWTNPVNSVSSTKVTSISGTDVRRRRKTILFHLTWKSLFHHVLDPSLSLRCYGCATRTCPVQWYRQCHLLDPSQRIKSSFGNFLGEFKDQLPTPTLWNLPPGILRITGFCSATTLKTAYNLSENMYIAFINQWRYFSRIR